MAGAAYALAARGEACAFQRTDGAALVGAGLLPPVLLTVAFPEGGYAPFPFSAYLPIPILARRRPGALAAQRADAAVGAVLYALGATLALVVPTAMGGNAVRLGALLAGPLLACSLSGRWRRPLVPIVMVLCRRAAVWQWSAAVRDVYKATTDPRRQGLVLRRRCASTCGCYPTSAASRSRSPWATGKAPRWRRTFRWRAAGCASSTRGATRSSTRAA